MNLCPRCQSKSYARFYQGDTFKCIMCGYEAYDVPVDIQEEVTNFHGKKVISRKDFRYKWD